MPELIEAPVVVAAAGSPPKRIEEFVGRVRTRTNGLSIARMVSPGGWTEAGQAPEFDEYTVVIAGILVAECRCGRTEVRPGQALFARAGEWVRYSTPFPEGAEYVSVCIPAFSPGMVHRDSAESA